MDTKLEIASRDPDIWYFMYRYDPKFSQLAQTCYGIRKYIELFTEVEIVPHLTIYRLFGKVNRADDLPTVVTDEGSTYWHRDGYLHRDNDKPAVIARPSAKRWDLLYVRETRNITYVVCNSLGKRMWYCNGFVHRSNNPALIYENNNAVWYWWGTICAVRGGNDIIKLGLHYDEHFT